MPYRTLLLFPAIVLGCNAGKTQAVNGAPVLDAVTITAEPDPATSASTLTCTATARDPDGDPLTTVLTWSRESDGAELGAGDTLDLTTAPVAPDEVVVCSATVTDPRGAHAAGSDTVQLGNQDPTVGDLVVIADTADERVYNDSTLACAGSVVDPEDRGVSVAYTWDNQTRSAPLGGGATVTLTAALATPGDALVCTAVATDADGGVATNSVAVTVENRPPAIGIVTLSPAAPASPDDVSCEGSDTSDPDGDDVALALSWQRDGLDDTAGATLAAPHAVGSVLTCVVTATDDHGDQTTASADVTVANTAPTVDSVEITPTEARVDETLTCSATASDVDGEVPAIRYAWSDGSAGATYTVVASDDPGDTITCTATAEDLRGGAAVGTAEATVANSVPMIAAVAISPATANNDDTLTCTATATDADGDAPGLTYTWTGSAAGSLGAGATLDLSATLVQSLETVACTATAADPDGGTAQDGAVLTVANRDPSVSVALDPAAGARRGDTLTCTASPADADGDGVGVSYSWTVDGIAWTGSGSTATASLLAGVFAKDQTVSCTATADDGKGGADAATTSTRIENTPPRLSTPALAPSTAYTDDTLAANVATSDDDGDSISLAFDWFVDGVRVQTGASNTLDGTLWFDRGRLSR